MEEVVIRGAVEDLQSVAEPLLTRAGLWAILLRVPGERLEDNNFEERACITVSSPQLEPAAWEKGCIFGPEGELRWDKTGGAFHVVYTGTPLYLPGLTTDPGIDLSCFKDARYYLWGRLVEEPVRVGEPSGSVVYAELQVPRLLRYPAAGAHRRVVLRVREYYDPSSGRLLFYRFYALGGAK